jgi:hypothetical protein
MHKCFEFYSLREVANDNGVTEVYFARSKSLILFLAATGSVVFIIICRPVLSSGYHASYTGGIAPGMSS